MKTRQARAVRGAVAVVVAVLSVGVAAGCSSKGADVSCSLSNCTVTFDRGVDAKASVLGVDVSLVGVDNGNVKVNIGGNEVTVPTGGSSQATGGGLTVTVTSVTADKVVLQISQN